MQTFSADGISFEVPSNWRQMTSQSDVQFAPDGAYGEQGITHGVLAGIAQGSSSALRDAQTYVNGVLAANDYLRQRGGLSRTTIDGRSGYYTTLSGISPVTGRTEISNVYMAQLRNGQLFYLITVVPENEDLTYSNTFRSVLDSIRLPN
jgi:hypothetical protein